jgi:hypothetical protein
MNHFNLIAARGLLACMGVVAAATCVAGNRAQPSQLTNSQSYASATHLYTYRYTLANPAGSAAPLDTLVVKLEPGVDVVTNFRAPPGWRAFYSSEKGTVMWAATGYVDPNAEAPDGDIPPSDYAIAPGASLAGFSFDSFSAPGTGVAISQNHAPLYAPQEDADYEALETSAEFSRLPEDNGYRLATVVPVPGTDWTGNRPPSVDGFLVFANVQDKASFQGSALIVFRLASAGEAVHTATLKAYLNGADVTASFAWSDQYKGYVATFALGVSPLKAGTNVLRTSVDGIVPGTTDRVATDTDRVSFELVP